jgi:hypothetical protein
MITRDMALQFLSQMPDQAVLQAFHVATGASPQMTSPQNPMMAGLSADDPANQVKGWSELTFDQGPDDRPALADKDYMIQKLAADQQMQQPRMQMGGMPTDQAETAYGMGL